MSRGQNTFFGEGASGQWSVLSFQRSARAEFHTLMTENQAMTLRLTPHLSRSG